MSTPTEPKDELTGLRQDLIDEQSALDSVVAVIGEEQWLRPTPSPDGT